MFLLTDYRDETFLALFRYAIPGLLRHPLRCPGGWISTQVINEVCKNLIAKASFQEDQVVKIISAFYRRCRVIELNQDILLAASELRATYLFSFWDSLIVASALAANIEILYSEDMQDGLEVLDRLEVVNPFK